MTFKSCMLLTIKERGRIVHVRKERKFRSIILDRQDLWPVILDLEGDQLLVVSSHARLEWC